MFSVFLDLFLIPFIFLSFALQSLGSYAEKRIKVYEHDWTILLEHEPIKHLIMSWAKGKYYNKISTLEDYLIKTSHALKEMGPKQCMHYGWNHETTTSKVNKAPSKLLTILWLLRYAIHDSISLDIFIKFLEPDRFSPTTKGVTTECSFLQVEFFHDYILTPITDIVIHMIEDKKGNIQNILLQHYILQKGVHWPKLSEFMMYALASSFIDIIMTNGSEPNFTTNNPSTQEIKRFLNKNAAEKEPSYSNILRATNLYELFFAALPNLLQSNIQTHWQIIFNNFIPKKHQQATAFVNNATMENFLIQLPLKIDDTKYKPVSLKDYFEAIRSGKVELTTIIGEKTKQNLTPAKSTTPSKTNKSPKQKDVQENTAKASGSDIDRITISMQYSFYEEHKKLFLDKYKTIQSMIIRNDPTENTRLFKFTQDLHTAAKQIFGVLDLAYDRKKKAVDRNKNTDETETKDV